MLHKIFISYYHDGHQFYKDHLVRIYHELSFIDRSVNTHDIDENLKPETIRVKIRDEYLVDTTVTIVLLGRRTKDRKFVDWEIASSLIDGALNTRNGLLGILLPDHPSSMNQANTQQRFLDNLECNYAELIRWSDVNSSSLKNAIERAFAKRTTVSPNNSAPWKRYNT